MDFNKRVHELLNQALTEQHNLFLVDLSIDSDSHIRVVLDGDAGVTLEQCMQVSRHIEHNFDREEHDFSLEVGSAGASAPPLQPRQYKKQKGRILKINTNRAEEIKGKLTASEKQMSDLQWKSREPKYSGKGKQTVIKDGKL